MVLVLFVIIYFYLFLFNYELYFVMLFLDFSVCEGSLGLSILVSIIRGFGNDYFQSYSVAMLWFYFILFFYPFVFL
jgi:NADH-ubiquinone oxidoreductase chain 4L